jgi:O-antigen ligase/Tfp pilus assembly protein PilF
MRWHYEMSIRSGFGAWLSQAVLAGAVAATLGGVYLGLPWPRLTLQAGILVAGLVWLIQRRRQSAAASVPGPVRGAAWLLLLVLSGSTLASTEIAVSLDATVQAVGYLVIVAMTASLLPAGPSDYALPSRVLSLLMLAGVAAVLIGVVFSWAGGADMHGSFGNKNHFAGYLLLFLPLALTAFLRSGTRKEMIAFGAAAVLTACGLLLSQSRGAWLALAPGLALVVLLQPRGWGIWFRLAGAGLLAVALSLLLNRAALQTTAWAGLAAVKDVAAATSGQPPEGTLGPRLDYWQGALAIARDYPFLGAGPGTFASVFPAYQLNPSYYSKYAHQVLLQALAETGSPGLLALLALLIASGWSVARGLPARLKNPATPESILTVGLAGGLVASFAHNLVELDWYVPAVAVVAAAEGGLLLALTGKGNGEAGSREAVPVKWAAASHWAALLVCFAGLAWTGVRAAEAWQLTAGRSALERGDSEVAAAWYRSASATDPLSVEPQKALAALALSRDGAPARTAPVDPGEGLDAARRAVSLASQDMDAWVLLSRGYQARGAAGDAGRAMESLAAAAALRQPSQAPAVYAELIQGYLAAGRSDEAADLCRLVVAGYSEVAAGTADAAYLAQAHVWLGNLAVSRGDTPEALAHYQSAVALNAANVAARFNLGVLLLEAGQPAAGRDALTAAAAMDSSQPVIHYYLGLAYEALGDKLAARSELETALALDPACQACLDVLGRLANAVPP